MSTPRPILLDTDIGTDVDDALALGLILACPEDLSLVAVTTVCGDTRLRARVAARLLASAGRGDVEVCAGEERPLLRAATSFAWFGHEERCLGSDPPHAISQESGPERIVRAARETPGLELVMIGPLTNLARALVIDPGLRQRLSRVTLMGGHIRQIMIGDFECSPGIDYNLCSDPEASVSVLGSGLPLTLVPGDVTLQTWMNTADLESLEAGSATARMLAEQVRIWSPVQRELFSGLGGTLAEDNEAFLHDPLTVLALIDPASLHFESLRIHPTIEASVLRTLEAPADGSQGGAVLQVATRVDARAAARSIVSRLRTL